MTTNEEDQVIPIIQLGIEMRNVTIKGTIQSVRGPHPFKQRPGCLGSLVVRDPTGIVQVKLWNNYAQRIKELQLTRGDEILLSGMAVRAGRKGTMDDPVEVHSWFTSAVEKVAYARVGKRQDGYAPKNHYEDAAEAADWMDEPNNGDDEAAWRESDEEICDATLRDLGYDGNPDDWELGAGEDDS